MKKEKKKELFRRISLILTLLILVTSIACVKTENPSSEIPFDRITSSESVSENTITSEDITVPEESEKAEKNGEIFILYTSDVHCGIDQRFGYAMLEAVRESLEQKGYMTLLVDDGDAVQGENIGTLSKGEAIIRLMNGLKYDVAIPGNHEFDYGMDQFFKLTEMADFPYISCNFNKEGELIFDPYIIKEINGTKIAFVGVTTPKTLNSSTPKYFQDENGNFIYGFMQDGDGSLLYETLQNAVDSARSEGADLVYVMAHTGNDVTDSPWTCEDIISHTSGIDVYLDGHSHDTEQEVILNKDGEPVPRSGVGTKMDAIGFSHISADGEILKTDILAWPSEEALDDFLILDNIVSEMVDEEKNEMNQKLGMVFAKTEEDLRVDDPVLVDDEGIPVQIVRRMETNMGDLCTDAYRAESEADIAILNSGAIRANIDKGDITYNDILSVVPFCDDVCVAEVTGQQILDALEWGASTCPDRNGGFLQVSGLSYTIDVNVKSSCVSDDNSMFVKVAGQRRVKDVFVGEDKIDPKKTYTVASNNYLLMENGVGYTMFDGAKIIKTKVKTENQCLIDYITDDLGGVVGSEYADPYGQGRITIIQ